MGSSRVSDSASNGSMCTMFEGLSVLQRKLVLFSVFYTINREMVIWNEIAKAMCALEVMSDHPDLVITLLMKIIQMVLIITPTSERSGEEERVSPCIFG